MALVVQTSTSNDALARQIQQFSLILLLSLCYYYSARLGLQLQFDQTQASPVWPPSGIALAALLLFGYRVSAGIFIGAFFANLVDFYLKSQQSSVTDSITFLSYSFNHPVELSVSVAIAVGNTLEAVCGYYLIRKFQTDTELLNSIKSVLLFAGVALVMCMVSSIVGVTSLVLGDILPLSLFGAVWFTWWLGDAAGVFILTPFIVVWSTFSKWPINKQVFLSQGVLIVGLMFISQLSFYNLYDIHFFTAQAYLLIPLILLITFTCDPRAGTLAVVAVGTISVVGTVNGYGPFIREQQNESLVLLQGFIAVISLTVLMLSAALSERKQALFSLRRANEKLEERVKARTKQLEKANEELENSNRELDDFAYIASHDLKEPLRGIENHVSFMLEDYQEKIQPEVVERLQKLTVITSHLESLINTLLHYSRVGRVDLALSKTSLQSVVGSVVTSLEQRLQERNVEIRIPSPLPTIVCDNARIGEVFRNLITNGLKYNDKPEKWIEIGYMDSEPQQFYVKDNGIGIREKHIDRIFQIFKRLHGRDKFGGGTGAGMTIIRKIVQRHGGKIWVESECGVGSTFNFTLSADTASSSSINETDYNKVA